VLVRVRDLARIISLRPGKSINNMLGDWWKFTDSLTFVDSPRKQLAANDQIAKTDF